MLRRLNSSSTQLVASLSVAPRGPVGLTGRRSLWIPMVVIHVTVGAFSVKQDATKVDRSEYAARYIAKNIVAAGLAKKAEAQLAYVIGGSSTRLCSIITFGTGTVAESKLEKQRVSSFDLRPAGLFKC